MLIVNDRYLAVCDAEEGVHLIGLDVIKRIEVKVADDQPEANQIKEMLDFIRSEFNEEADHEEDN